jgi:hypothetical protein
MYSCDVLLYEGDAPVDDGLIPVVPYHAYKDGTFYGFSEIRNIKSIQKSFNDMDYAEYKGLRLNTNSGWVKDDTSGVDSSELTNEEGIVITKAQGTECSRLPPGQVSPQLERRKMNDKNEFYEISGINEATQGLAPDGVTAARALRSIREQAVGRIRAKQRIMEEYSIPRLGKLLASRIIKYWSTERMLRTYDKNGKLNYISYDPEKIQQLMYEIWPVVGSTAGMDKESINAAYKDLLMNQIITPRLFFDVVDLPYKAKVIDYLDEQDQLAAQLEQLTMENSELKAQLGIPEQAPGQEQQQVMS